LDMARNLAVRLFPGDVLPLRTTRTSHLGLQQPALIQDVLIQRSAFGTQRAAIDRMVGIAFYVDHLRGDVLGLVAKRMDDHSTAHRTIRTRGTCLSSSGNLKFFGLRQDRAGIKSHQKRSGASGPNLEEFTSR